MTTQEQLLKILEHPDCFQLLVLDATVKAISTQGDTVRGAMALIVEQSEEIEQLKARIRELEAPPSASPSE